MKEASGELNMTVITVVAIAAVAAFFYAFVWPSIQNSIARNTCNNSCAGGVAVFTPAAGGAEATCECDGVVISGGNTPANP